MNTVVPLVKAVIVSLLNLALFAKGLFAIRVIMVLGSSKFSIPSLTMIASCCAWALVDAEAAALGRGINDFLSTEGCSGSKRLPSRHAQNSLNHILPNYIRGPGMS